MFNSKFIIGMKKILLALLQTKFTGVRQDGLMALARSLALQCATEEEAAVLVEKITDAQVNEFIKEYRADVDKEVSESNKTYETNLKKKFNFVEKKVEPGNESEHNQNDLSSIVEAAIAKAVKPIQDKLASYETDYVAKSRLQSLNDKLASCNDDNFRAQTLKDFARMKFESDDDFNAYLTEKATDIETANQSVANSKLSNQGGSPLFSQKEESGVSKGVAEYLDSQKPESKTLSGKEV